jgi:hypothetical protein
MCVVEDTGSVTSRVQYLMTFVIGGYVTLVVNRWNTLRNTTLGQLWGALENLVIYSSYCCIGKGPEVSAIRDDILRFVSDRLGDSHVASCNGSTTDMRELSYC